MPRNGERALGWNIAIMTAEMATYVLPETVKVEECHALDQFIRSRADCAIQLQGHKVQKFGGLAAQLIAAHQQIRHDTENQISLINPSDALSSSLATLGLGHLLGNERRPS